MRSTNGFTLIELLVTLAIMALIMVALLASLHGTVKAHDEIQVEMASVRDGPQILDMVENDLRGLHLFNMKDGLVLRGKAEKPGAMVGDRIDLLCANDSTRRLTDTDSKSEDALGVASDVNEIGYRLRKSAISDDFMELWRREDLFVDDEPFEGGTYEKIHDRITKFHITYFEELGPKAEEQDEWDMAEKKKLPAAVHIALELQASPELIGGFVELQQLSLRLYSYDRVIPIAAEQTTALAVRPYLPTKITGRNDGAGGGGGGASGTDGEGITSFTGGSGDEFGKGGKDGRDRSMMKEGGNDLIDNIDDLRNKQKFNIFGPGATDDPKLIIGDGELTPQDEKKIEDFMNDYRNRYNSGGTGAGPGGKS
jgi:type II secretion system protein J